MSHVRGSKKNPSVDERPVILALEYPKFNASSSVRRPSIPRPRIPKHPITSFAAELSPFIVTIKTGEVASFINFLSPFRVFFYNKNSLQKLVDCSQMNVAKTKHEKYVIICIIHQLTKNNLLLYLQGNFSIATLTGRFVISNNGPVQLDYLKVSFQPQDVLVCGTTIGPLIAGCAVQVSFFSYNSSSRCS
ncbi:hypothetical protein MIMGU_mgv1a025915mg [Erythranthe guttata]|uniref:AT-hook motif nuclear-localized protein n=1 Tax=Erythranthe guttata TaxID=4155 RepID=A0A022RM09_ERYGU|nr:hypothetical protein MIMGU_mgv1a025915mg [Erythranthe guttata]